MSDDIFVSYAHVDNSVLPGEKAGWVSKLVEDLRLALQLRLGGEGPSFLMDREEFGFRKGLAVGSSRLRVTWERRAQHEKNRNEENRSGFHCLSYCAS